MEPINRYALIVRPKRRFMEWANEFDDGGPQLTLDELPSLTEVYLLDATDTEADRAFLIDTYAEEIWEQQLAQWSTDESTWPKNRTPHALRDWFDLNFVDMVYDADPDVDWDEPLASDQDMVEEETRICQWCHTVSAPDDVVFSLPLSLPEGDPAHDIEGPLVPMMIAGALRIAIKVGPDSEAARAGKHLVLAFCSERCAQSMREAILRERGALLS